MPDNKMQASFFRTKRSLSDRIKGVFSASIGNELYDELIEALVLSDIPYLVAEEIVETARKSLAKSQGSDEEAVRQAVGEAACQLLESAGHWEGFQKPSIILVCGVNGAGKTTTIGKLASLFLAEGHSVLLAAADTFRAAAGEQLSILAQRAGAPLVGSAQGQDAAGVVFDAIASAKARSIDYLICDTAGRQHTNKNLMAELNKIYRVAERNKEGYNLYVAIVLDAMSGQNSIAQLELFGNSLPIDSILLTKMDGSAKGGAILGMAKPSGPKVAYIGTGERLEDLEPFDARVFVNEIFS
ncbi:MAG: signal recognition particle-docking protein FtsY [Eubacteriaceae bacterium]|nr:signal recognition particle-docking protein FtsY [Eubacteriaceae bacterium]